MEKLLSLLKVYYYFLVIISYKNVVETLGQCSIKYFALKTSSFFNEIVNEARSVIVAGNFIFIFFLKKSILFLRRNNETGNN
jgi:hypothetical protein